MIPTLLVLSSVVSTPPTDKPFSPKPELRCGLYCLFLSLRALDVEIADLETLEKRMGPVGPHGYSLKQLADAAEGCGALTLGVKTNLDRLRSRTGRFACIALLEDSSHFVCISNIDDNNVYAVDPPELRQIPLEAFSKVWSGKALLISKSPLRLDVEGYALWQYAAVFSIVITSLLGLYRVLRWVRGNRSRGAVA